MCKKRNSIKINIFKDLGGYTDIRLDSCLKHIIKTLNETNKTHYETLASCCGHGRYPMTIVIQDTWHTWELFSGIELKRKKRFYVKDSEGFYYIPEVSKVINQGKNDV